MFKKNRESIKSKKGGKKHRGEKEKNEKKRVKG